MPNTGGGRITTVNIPVDLHQRARAAVRIVREATGRRYTIAQFFREAITKQLNAISRDYNQGREILPDPTPLDAGRPDGPRQPT